MYQNMSRSSQFAKNTLILSIGNFLPKFVSFVTLPILTAYLTKDEYGTYDFIDLKKWKKEYTKFLFKK